ncbi:MAG TPA: DUF927 domain-containing protein [Stellaceae bacterium]|jgi:hypothetical protein|nr:DUF927 domain-containing protein [Stellaceae bacterium]
MYLKSQFNRNQPRAGARLSEMGDSYDIRLSSQSPLAEIAALREAGADRHADALQDAVDGWRAAAAAAVSVGGCPHWILGVAAGFTGPLVGLTGLDTCGVNLSGLSSSGKSLAQRLAASVWSIPDARKPGLFQSARATDNAVEALAQRATGTVLVLDELAHVSGKQAANPHQHAFLSSNVICGRTRSD